MHNTQFGIDFSAVAYKAVKLGKQDNKCTNKWILEQSGTLYSR